MIRLFAKINKLSIYLSTLNNHLPPADLVLMSPSLETFLLCSAALANLTTLCPAALPVVTDAALVAVLLGHPAAAARSVYILEQLVTVLVNLAKLPHARNQMTQVVAGDVND